MSKGSWEYMALYMMLVVGNCLFFGLLYVFMYAVAMMFEVIPRLIYRIWKEKRNERDTRRKDHERS